MCITRHIRQFFFLLILLNCAQTVYSMEQSEPKEEVEFIKGLQGFFQKRMPFYGISVSRETFDDRNYPKLTKEEQSLVFNTLGFLLGQPNELPEFLNCFLKQFVEKEIKFLKEFQEDYEKRYEELNKHFISDLDNLNVDILKIYLNDKSNAKNLSLDEKDFLTFLNGGLIKEIIIGSLKIEDLKKEIGKYISESEKTLITLIKNKKYIDKELGGLKRVSGFPLFEKQLLHFLSNEQVSKYFLQKVEVDFNNNERGDLLNRFFDLKAREQKDPGFISVYTQKDESLHFLKKIRDKIANGNSLFIFNEMFFGKSLEKEPHEGYAPLSNKEFVKISDQLINLSKAVPSALFHVNFLYFDKEEMFGIEYKTLIDEIKEKLKSKNIKEYSIFDDPETATINWDFLLNKVSNEQKYKIFKNESLIYSHGRIVGSYQKASYKDEANAFLEHTLNGKENSLYLFGKGQDIAADKSLLAQLINNYISTEICFDLEMGMRHKLNNHPPEGKIHIFVSNTLPLSLSEKTDVQMRNRFNNLPDSIPLIFHVDPIEQDFFLNPPKKDLFLNEYFMQTKKPDIFQLNKKNNLILQEPIFRPIRLGVGNSVFTFKIWDINAAIDKVNEY